MRCCQKTLKLLHQSSMTLLGQTPSDEDTCITTVEEDEEAKLLSFCNVLNDKIHKQIKYTTTCDEKSPYDISNFSLQNASRTLILFSGKWSYCSLEIGVKDASELMSQI